MFFIFLHKLKMVNKMNQILTNTDYSKNEETNINLSLKHKSKAKIKFIQLKKIYQSIFLLSFTLLLFLLFYIFISQFQFWKNELFSQKLVNNYSVLSLYQNNLSSSNVILESKENSLNLDVCGIIEIPSLNLSYPIFSTVSEKLLKISVCRFYGEMPPAHSNLCIAGHNYENGKFFSLISNLKKEDKIHIYDVSHHKYTYSVFNQYEVKTDDLSPLSYDSNSCQLTLVTCNNWNKHRIIIKALLLESN